MLNMHLTFTVTQMNKRSLFYVGSKKFSCHIMCWNATEQSMCNIENMDRQSFIND